MYTCIYIYKCNPDLRRYILELNYKNKIHQMIKTNWLKIIAFGSEQQVG